MKGTLMRLRLLLAACFLLWASGLSFANSPQLENEELWIVPPPSFKRARRPSGQKAKRKPQLAVMSSRANNVTDTSEWFTRNRLELPLYEVTDTHVGGDGSPVMPLPANVPTRYSGNILTQAIRQDQSTILFYGRNYAEGRYLIAIDAETGRFRYGIDFANYAYAPGLIPKERDFVFQNLDWAIEEGDTLYVSHSHSTYARSSRGMNAYITALDVRNRKGPVAQRPSGFKCIEFRTCRRRPDQRVRFHCRERFPVPA